jgi:hypothetical protein
MNNIQDELRSRIDAFVDELAGIVRQSALEAVRSALGEAGAPRAVSHAAAAAPPSRGRRGRPRGAVRRTAAKSVVRVRAKPGQKRDPKVLARLVDRLATYIATNPGQRIEQINKALGVPTKDLSLPIKKLLRAGRISSKGQKRSTTYLPRG